MVVSLQFFIKCKKLILTCHLICLLLLTYNSLMIRTDATTQLLIKWVALLYPSNMLLLLLLLSFTSTVLFMLIISKSHFYVYSPYLSPLSILLIDSMLALYCWEYYLIAMSIPAQMISAIDTALTANLVYA